MKSRCCLAHVFYVALFSFCLSLLTFSSSVFAQEEYGQDWTEEFEESILRRTNPALAKELAKLRNIASGLCLNIYPKQTISDCFDKIYRGMLSQFDPHSSYVTGIELLPDNFKGSTRGVLGVLFLPSENETVLRVLAPSPGGPAEKAGLKSGDLVIAINGALVSGFVGSKEISLAFDGKVGEAILLSVSRGGGKPFPITIIRAKYPTGVSTRIMSDSTHVYGVIQLHSFDLGLAEDLEKEVRRLIALYGRSLRGLILSVESNPGGKVVEAVNAVDLFLDAPNILLERNREKIVPYTSFGLTHTPGDITGGLPILIVMDGASASASEAFAAAMRHFGRAVLAGVSETYGKGTMQQGGHGASFSYDLHLTIGEYLVGTMRDWVSVQCIGVKPDIVLPHLRGPSFGQWECKDKRALKGSGVMPKAPKHAKYRDLYPTQYRIILDMVEAYKKDLAGR